MLTLEIVQSIVNLVHCWNYRRFIVEKFDYDLNAELHYSSLKIRQNFSNYSAWHHRSTLIPRIFNDKSKASEFILKGSMIE